MARARRSRSPRARPRNGRFLPERRPISTLCSTCWQPRRAVRRSPRSRRSERLQTAIITGLNLLSTSLPLSSGGAKATVVHCYDCHGDGATGTDMDGTRSAATGSFVGSHNKHVTSLSYACTNCHVEPPAPTPTVTATVLSTWARTFFEAGTARRQLLFQP